MRCLEPASLQLSFFGTSCVDRCRLVAAMEDMPDLPEEAPPLWKQPKIKRRILEQELPWLRGEMLRRGCQITDKLLTMWSRGYEDYQMTICMEYFEDWLQSKSYQVSQRLMDEDLDAKMESCAKLELAWLQVVVNEIYCMNSDDSD